MGHSVDLKTQFGEILKANGIKNKISDVVTRSVPELKGAHMASLIEYATISFTDGSKEPLELFLKKKMTTGNEILDQSFDKITLKEGKILTKFVDDMKKFCKDKIGTEDLIKGLFPRVYHCDGDMIVMDNLVKQDYGMLPKSEKQDMASARFVLKNLAGFHAVSHAMICNAGGKDKFQAIYPFIEDYMLSPETPPMMDQMYDSNITTICNLLEKAGSAEDLTLSSLLKRRLGSYFSQILECITCEDIFPVVNHGDCWNNNLLFKSGKQDEDRKMVFVDLQMSRIGSPNLDLAYYMFTSLKPELRKQWKELLEYYFSHLKATVLNLGQEFKFEFNDFVEDFRRKSKLGFLFGLILVITFQAMDNHDTDKAHEEGEDLIEKMKTMMKDWIEQNPDKCANACADIKSLVDDYLLFGQI